MHDARRWSLPAVIGAIGIVYGDIGTSPLYAFETALNATGTFDPGVVLGVLSLIFWSLMLSVTFKSVTLIVLAMLFLIQKRGTARVGRLFGPVMILWFVALAVTGASAIRLHPSV